MLTVAIVVVVWLLWLPVCLLDRSARGATGGVSIFPVLPVMPMIFAGLAALLDLVAPSLGLIVVGGAHGVLALVMAVSALRSWRMIRGRRGGAVDEPGD